MKRFYTLFISLCFSAAAFAQYDVAVVGIINPDTTQELPYDFNDSLIIAIGNFGDSLVIGDTLNLIGSVTAGGVTVDSAFVLTLPVGQTIPSGVALGAISPAVDLGPLLGSFQGQQVTLCFRTDLVTGTDANPSNDQYCFEYTVSSSMSTGLELTNNKQITTAYYNNQLVVNNNNGRVSLYNLAGQVVYQNSVIKAAYDLNLNNGIYIVTVDQNGNITHSNKIAIQ